MQERGRKTLSSLLAFSMLLGALSIPAAAVSADDGFSCGKEVHAHSEACYEETLLCGHTEAEHVHDETCISVNLICETTVHQHEKETCLTSEDLAELTEVIAAIDAVPTLQEMQNARSRYSTSSTVPAKDAAAAYDAYLQTSWESRAAAQDAYNALTPAQKSFVPADTLARLTDTLPDVYGSGSRFEYTLAEDDGDEYIYTWPGNDGSKWAAGIYEWSPHQNGDGESPVTFMLVNTTQYGGKTWAPDGPYNEDNNYVLAYCSDAITPIDYQRYYRRINLEDSTYYEAEQSEQIRAIVLNAYPFVSEDEMHKAMYGKLHHKDGTAFTNAEVDTINYVEMLSAAQFAIWSYANFADGDSFVDAYGNVVTREMVQYYGNTYYTGPSYAYHYVGNDLWCWWGSVSGNYQDEVGDHIDAVVDYLRALPPQKPLSNQKVITDIDVLSIRTKAEPDADGIVPIEVTVRLNAAGQERDDLALSAVGEVDSVSEQVAGKTVHTLSLDAKAGETLQLSVEGTQTLGDGVYFYEAKPVGTASARDTSQNLVGVASGTTPVYATVMVNLDEDSMDNPEDLHSVSFTKTVEVQAGGESPAWPIDFSFTLTNVDTGEALSAQKTFSAEGSSVVTFPSVAPGTYTLTESELPEKWSTDFESYTVVVEDKDVTLSVSDVDITNLYSGDALTYTVSFTKQTAVAEDSLQPSWPVEFSFTLTNTEDESQVYTATCEFTAAGEKTIVFEDIPAGTYLLEEGALPDGWSSEFTSKIITISDADITLSDEEDVIINTYSVPDIPTDGDGQPDEDGSDETGSGGSDSGEQGSGGSDSGSGGSGGHDSGKDDSGDKNSGKDKEDSSDNQPPEKPSSDPEDPTQSGNADAPEEPVDFNQPGEPEGSQNPADSSVQTPDELTGGVEDTLPQTGLPWMPVFILALLGGFCILIGTQRKKILNAL